MSDKPISEGDEQPEGQSPPAEPVAAEPEAEQVGDFITRHILEKDTVFFEG